MRQQIIEGTTVNAIDAARTSSAATAAAGARSPPPPAGSLVAVTCDITGLPTTAFKG